MPNVPSGLDLGDRASAMYIVGAEGEWVELP